MASAATSRPARALASRPSPDLRLLGLRWHQHLVRVLLFSVPFAALALYAAQLGFLSNAHAHVTAKALLAADRLRLEVIGFLYPPLPFLLVLPFPHPWTPALLSSLAAGATAWLVWYDLERTGLGLLWRMMLLAAVVVTPSSVFLATQAFPDMLTLHFLVVAWHYYWNFVRYQHTFSGFVAGLILGLAFYANFYALLYALAFAVLVPLFRRAAHERPEPREFAASLSQMLVTAFPALWALASWSYINWVFTGRPFMYLADPAAAVIDPDRWSVPLDERLSWLPQFGVEVLSQPLLLAAFLVHARVAPRRLPVLAVLAFVPALVRLCGFSYPLPLVLGSYTLIALLSLPQRQPRWFGPFLVVLAVTQGFVAATLVRQVGEVRAWENVVTSGASRAEDQQEIELASRLRAAPDRSILADDRSAYRIVARAVTARPFLLPTDAAFAVALDDPVSAVRYVLVTAVPMEGDLVSARFAAGPPAGFVVDGQRGVWTLYRRSDAPSLLGGA